VILRFAGPYWRARQNFAALSEAGQRLFLQGEILLVLRETRIDAVKHRLRKFIAHECARHGIDDRSEAILRT
jgi:hypothetical protein